MLRLSKRRMRSFYERQESLLIMRSWRRAADADMIRRITRREEIE
jgi:hypothetical protein